MSLHSSAILRTVLKAINKSRAPNAINSSKVKIILFSKILRKTKSAIKSGSRHSKAVQYRDTVLKAINKPNEPRAATKNWHNRNRAIQSITIIATKLKLNAHSIDLRHDRVYL
jgi:hypothetical protein